jgi:hypothetical protein
MLNNQDQNIDFPLDPSLQELRDMLNNGRTHLMDLLMVLKTGDEALKTTFFWEIRYEGNKLVCNASFIDGKTYLIELSERI